MKVSEITEKELVDYIRPDDYAEGEFDRILSATKRVSLY